MFNNKEAVDAAFKEIEFIIREAFAGFSDLAKLKENTVSSEILLQEDSNAWLKLYKETKGVIPDYDSDLGRKAFRLAYRYRNDVKESDCNIKLFEIVTEFNTTFECYRYKKPRISSLELFNLIEDVRYNARCCMDEVHYEKFIAGLACARMVYNNGKKNGLANSAIKDQLKIMLGEDDEKVEQLLVTLSEFSQGENNLQNCNVF